MIGPDWAGDEQKRTRANDARQTARIGVVTGTRAEFGLLTPVMHAVEAHPGLELMVIAAGSHMVQPGLTYRDIKKQFEVTDSIPMQVAGRVGRFDDVEALGRGVARFGRSFDRLKPDWVVVLGDRIEAFAAASAASVGGVALAHLHGGDVAEGVADEAMRHAITKLAHLHFPATEQSAARIRSMGEPPERVVVAGSPAIDGLAGFEPMGDDEAQELGDPDTVLLFHPTGRTDEREEATAWAAIEAIAGRRALCLMPNLDPGRRGVVRAIERAKERPGVVVREHLARAGFVGLLKRLAARGGLLVGNSSAALIEAGAVGLPAVNIGQRQSGRERGTNVVDAAGETPAAIAEGVESALSLDRSAIRHPFGDGRCGLTVAGTLADLNGSRAGFVRKRWADVPGVAR